MDLPLSRSARIFARSFGQATGSLDRLSSTCSSAAWLALVALLTAAIFAFDIETPTEGAHGPYYLLAVVLAGLKYRARQTALIAALIALVRIYALHLSSPTNELWPLVSDAALALLIFVGTGLGVVAYTKLNRRLLKYNSLLLRAYRSQKAKHRLVRGFRRAVPSDVDDLLDILTHDVKAGLFMPALLDPKMREAYGKAVQQVLSNGVGLRDVWTGGRATVPADYWVAEINGKIAAYMFVCGLGEKNPDDRELHYVSVAPMYRGLGLGSAMTDFFIKTYRGRRQVIGSKPGTLMNALVRRREFKMYANRNGFELFERNVGL
ncbi:MAG: GNAT family N-acetyltransferase [Reyranellaceae bacterium]